MKLSEESFLVRAARYYNEEAHQVLALEALWAQLTPLQRNSFRDGYRGLLKPATTVLLDVPYFYQRDSKTGHGERSCFSSAMAMALDYIDPDAIQGDDDWYLEQVFKFGDTVSSDAQVETAEYLDFDAEFRMDGTEETLVDILTSGIPVPIGILHRGHVDSPQGGGHWICLIGYDKTHFYVHDPFGELDLVLGGYPKAGPTDGRFQRYSRKNLMKRWLISSDHDGWMMRLG